MHPPDLTSRAHESIQHPAMASYQKTTYGHRKLSPLATGGQRFIRGHRTTESIDLNSLSPAPSSNPWCFFDFTGKVRCSTGPDTKISHQSWPVLLLNVGKTLALLYILISVVYSSIQLLERLGDLEHLMRHVHSRHAPEYSLDTLLDDSPGFRLKARSSPPICGYD
ncbi:hypothetical protein M407DRAFT_19659 [Tulasnella calospora MUT 4182]|uniref:Uncharacterized protein n=1 Tax=Tulasnella calospora MUT 4182 TaxID=1051891 RepID=A0A0C3QHH1_9AGAM|nr:hypothetical protein M407DRAFT_19659 [Tulasnella calospora MUT 4182]